MSFPKKLQQKIEARKINNSLRNLGSATPIVDFSSNDYLGFAKSKETFTNVHQFLIDKNLMHNGATGSRLLSGNHILYGEVEEMLANSHESEAVLIFNSGYDANIGLFSSVPQRGDIILYDELIHASIRDGIQLSSAKAYKFKHNDLEDLEAKISRFIPNDFFDKSGSFRADERDFEIYVATESVFSMDGDTPDLKTMLEICKKYKAHFIVDEAHAVGVFEEGLVQKLHLQDDVFARLVTFGKALGCHGAAILGSHDLKQYLVNFARSFIYTTGLPPHSLATIKLSYGVMLSAVEASKKLHHNIHHFKEEIRRLGFLVFSSRQMPKEQRGFIESNSAIHCCLISGNEKTKQIAQKLQERGFYVKPILSPTVSVGQERLRFCLHAYNSKQEITAVLENLATFVK